MSIPAGAPGQLVSVDPDHTGWIGAALGAALRPGDVVSLEGPLGAGKTCLVRGMVAGMGGDAGAVRSPTFVLHQPHSGPRLTLHHIDLYRLGEGADVEFLDLEAMVEAGAVIIEWGSYADLSLYAPQRIEVSIEADDRRVLSLAGGAEHIVATWSALAGPPR